MNDNRAHLVTGEIQGHGDPSDAQKILDFFSLQSNATRSFRADLDMNSGVAQCSQQIKAHSAYELWMDASLGNPDSCLELGLRSVLVVCSLKAQLMPGRPECTPVVVLPKTRTAH